MYVSIYLLPHYLSINSKCNAWESSLSIVGDSETMRSKKEIHKHNNVLDVIKEVSLAAN